MTGVIDWAASRARMVIAFVILSLTVGAAAYVGLPKEGEPDIDIPGLFVSVPFPGISAEDSERLLVKADGDRVPGPRRADHDHHRRRGYAGVASNSSSAGTSPPPSPMCATRMGRAEAEFPAGAESYSINEINFSEFPIIVVACRATRPNAR
jgi:multidrug efflux pump